MPRLAAIALVATSLLAVAAACSSDDAEPVADEAAPPTGPVAVGDEVVPPEVTQHAADWPLPGRDHANSRAVTDSPIDASDRRRLARGRVDGAAARARGPIGNASTTPLVLGDRVLVQDLRSNVRAFDLATGELVWEAIVDGVPDRAQRRGRRLGPGVRHQGDGAGDGARRRTSGEELWSDRARRHPDRGHRHPAPGRRRPGAVSAPCPSASTASTRAATAACSTPSTPRPARWCGASTPSSATTCGATRRSTRAAGRGTRRRSTPSAGDRLLGHRQPGAVPRHPRAPERVEPARARTSTPTRWSRSTSRTGELLLVPPGLRARPLRPRPRPHDAGRHRRTAMVAGEHRQGRRGRRPRPGDGRRALADPVGDPPQRRARPSSTVRPRCGPAPTAAC